MGVNEHIYQLEMFLLCLPIERRNDSPYDTKILHLHVEELIWNLFGIYQSIWTAVIVVHEFELQSRYYVLFRANTLGKGMNPHILPAMGEIVPLLFFYGNGFGIK